MSLINESHDSLIYVDSQPSSDALATVSNLIASELQTVDTTEPHPLLPPGFAPRFTPLLQREHDRLEAGLEPEKGIDISRYESLEAPSVDALTNAEDQGAALNELRETLRKASTAQSYLQWRGTNLGLLEKYGKNSWLIGNAQLEDVLRSLERELADKKQEVEQVESERRQMQENIKGEVATLENTWKTGIGRMIETQVAVEGLKQQILQKRREGAVHTERS